MFLTACTTYQAEDIKARRHIANSICQTSTSSGPAKTVLHDFERYVSWQQRLKQSPCGLALWSGVTSTPRPLPSHALQGCSVSGKLAQLLSRTINLGSAKTRENQQVHVGILCGLSRRLTLALSRHSLDVCFKTHKLVRNLQRED